MKLQKLGYRDEPPRPPAVRLTRRGQCSPVFPNHLELAVNDWFEPAAAFLGTAPVDRNPPHVTLRGGPGARHPEVRASSPTTPTGCRG